MAWALSLGACLGGNCTIVGSASNVLAVALAERNGLKISFVQWMKYGGPIVLLNVIVCMVYLMVVYVGAGYGG